MLEQADALLVIDMQNSFLEPAGAMYRYRGGGTLLDIEMTVANTLEAVSLAGERNLPVIYTRHCYRSNYADAAPRTTAAFHAMGVQPLVSGSWDAAVIDALPVGPDSLVVDKTRFDAFYNTDLEILLRGLSASRLVIAGIVTNACVETTVRAAAMRDFDVTVLADCCTTYSAEHQTHALEALEFYMLASVRTMVE